MKILAVFSFHLIEFILVKIIVELEIEMNRY